jgi:signal-transduction protein with cAMP-binding, CBS, and nucleotidyltransferase domain
MSSSKIITASVETEPSAMDVTKSMIKNGVGSVVIVDSGNKPIGIITERDLLKKIFASGKSPKDITAKDIMSSPVITVQAIDSVETASAVMTKNRIKRLVVLEQDGSLAGVLSVTDITRKLARILVSDYNRYGFLKAVL